MNFIKQLFCDHAWIVKTIEPIEEIKKIDYIDQFDVKHYKWVVRLEVNEHCHKCDKFRTIFVEQA